MRPARSPSPCRRAPRSSLLPASKTPSPSCTSPTSSGHATSSGARYPSEGGTTQHSASQLHTTSRPQRHGSSSARRRTAVLALATARVGRNVTPPRTAGGGQRSCCEKTRRPKSLCPSRTPWCSSTSRTTRSRVCTRSRGALCFNVWYAQNPVGPILFASPRVLCTPTWAHGTRGKAKPKSREIPLRITFDRCAIGLDWKPLARGGAHQRVVRHTHSRQAACQSPGPGEDKSIRTPLMNGR